MTRRSFFARAAAFVLGALGFRAASARVGQDTPRADVTVSLETNEVFVQWGDGSTWFPHRRWFVHIGVDPHGQAAGWAGFTHWSHFRSTVRLDILHEIGHRFVYAHVYEEHKNGSRLAYVGECEI